MSLLVDDTTSLRALVAMLACLLAAPAWARAPGVIEGRIVDSKDAGVPGVTVSIDRRPVAITDGRGHYVAADLPAGTCRLVLSLGEHTAAESVEVPAGGVLSLVTAVDWPLLFAETLTVHAASRHAERLVEAPSAAASLGAGEIARRAGHGQLPLLLTSLPGTHLAQSGLYDFNLNARGFNTYVNRRVLTLIDGRDPSIPTQAGGQEWAALSFPLDDLARVELVRGPGAALYGAGAFNGVLDMTTKAPGDSPGGRLRLVAGEPESVRLDLRHAGGLGDGWFYKLIAGYSDNDDPTRSRMASVEYAPGSLPREAVAPPEDSFDSIFGSLRLDRILQRHSLVLEAGGSRFGGTTFVSDLGRLQTRDADRPWARFRWWAPSYQVSGFYTAQEITHAALASGGALYLDAYHLGFEAQADATFAGGRGRLVVGAAYGERSSDSAGPDGRQTVLSSPRDIDRQAVFGQVAYELGDAAKAVVSLRWDDSTLHDPEVSPRLALVYSLTPRHTLRATYSEAFQSPTVAEFFLRAAVGPALDLSALEQALAPVAGGTELGFGHIPLLAVGNENLEIERVESFELGYTGIAGEHLFLTLSGYRNRLSDFTTNLIFQVGTSLGRLNPDFGPYTPPAGLPDEAAAAVLAALAAALPPDLFAALTNDENGNPMLALLSRTSFGRAETRGLEASATWAPTAGWTVDLAYTYFDFEIDRQAAESPILPNSPRHQVAAGVAYAGERLDAGLRLRWVEGFDWSSGIFIGEVPDYSLLDLDLDYRLSDRLALGLRVANLLDDRHIEQFGGDLLPRRALASLTFRW